MSDELEKQTTPETNSESALLLASKATSGTVQLFTQSIALTIISFFSFAIIARILSLIEVGVYSGLTMISQVFVAIFSIGLATTASRFISVSIAKGGTGVSKFVKAVQRYAVILGLFAFLVCSIFAPSISQFLFQTGLRTREIQLLGLDIWAWIVISVTTGVLLGLMRYRNVVIVTVITHGSRAILGILFLLMGDGIIGLVRGWAISDCLGAIVLVILGHRGLQQDKSQYDIKTVIQYQIPIYFAEILYIASYFIDRLAVLNILGPDSLAIYHAVLMIFSVLLLLSRSAVSGLLPAISRIEGGVGREAVKRAGNIASRYIFMIYIPFAFLLAGFASPALIIIGGPSYSQGSFLLQSLLLASAVLSGVIVLEIVAKSHDDTRQFFAVYAIAVIFEAIACLGLIPEYGIIGAVLARIILYVTLYVGLLQVLRNRQVLGLDFGAQSKLIVAALIGYVPVVIVTSISTNIYILLSAAAAYGVLIVICLRTLRLAKTTDYEILRSVLPEKIVSIVEYILGGTSD